MTKILILLLICGLALAACTGKPSAPQQPQEPPAQPEKPQVPSNPDALSDDPQDYVYRLTYKETSADGNEYSIFAEKSYDQARLHITEPGGSEKLFYVPVKMLYDLKQYNDREQLTGWNRQGPDTPDLDKDPKIRVTMMINNRSFDFGTNHMPDPAFIDKLHHVKETVLSYASEDTQIQAFDVEIAGKTYHTVSGTGNIQGTGAKVDFAGDKWWQVLGYTGRYENEKGDYLQIFEDGRIVVKAENCLEEGSVDPDYLWQCYCTALGGQLNFVFLDEEGSGNTLRAYMTPEPYPGTFPGFDVELTRVSH